MSYKSLAKLFQPDTRIYCFCPMRSIHKIHQVHKVCLCKTKQQFQTPKPPVLLLENKLLSNPKSKPTKEACYKSLMTLSQFQQPRFPGWVHLPSPFPEVPLRLTLNLTREESEVEKSATFTCTLSKVDLRVSWYKEEQKILASSKHELVDEGRMHKLIVHDLCPADYADYLVVIGSRRLTGRRVLEEAPLEFTIPLTEQTCKEGETVTFKCEVTESDLPATWFKDGQELTLSDQVIATVDGKTHTLTIKDAPLDAAAEYTVKIKDKESKARLNVQEVEADFTLPLSDTSAQAHESATFTCEVSKDDADVQWLVNDKEITPSDKFQVAKDGRKHSLTVVDLQPEDSGEFTARVGGKDTSASLTVAEEPLEIIVPLKEQEVIEGDTVTLTCKVNKPNVEATWYKENSPFTSSDKCVLKVEGDTHTLTLPAADLEDEAEYTIKLGDKSSTALLLVEEAPLCITQPIQDMECLEGETVSFVCECNKENAPAMWLKDGHVITEEDGYEFIMDGRRHILKIPETTVEHDAEFTVKINGCESTARLRVDEVAAEFTATLKDVEGREGQDVELECILNKPGVKVRWLKNKKPLTPSDRIKIVCDRYRHILRIMDTIPEDEGEYTAVLPSNRESSANLKIYEIPPFFTMPLNDQELPEKETAIFECQVSKKDRPVKWLKDGKEVELDDRIQAITDGFYQQLVIEDCRLEDAGKYSCVMGDEVTEANLVVEELPVEILKPLRNATITEGDKLVLEVELSKPDFPVTWKRDGVTFKPGENSRVTVDGCIHRLEIDAAELEDEANYSLHADDKSCKALVLVEETSVEIVKPLEDQNILEKEPIKFTCELSKPGVKVSWLKDGFKVSEDDGFKITVDGNLHTITKDSATLEDAGKYMLVFEDKKTSGNLGVEPLKTEIVRPLPDITVTENQSLALECEVNQPDKPAHWFVNGEEVSASARLRLESEGKVHKLAIDSAELDDGGVYKIDVDGATSESSVVVKEEPLEITKPLGNMEITEGEKAIFTCEVSRPDLAATWSFNDKEITTDDGYDITVVGKTHQLSLDKAEVDDAGKYKVKIKDKESSAKLKVREIPVEFTKPLKDIEVTENQPLILTCEVNKPDLEAKWTKEGKVIDSSDRVQVSRDGFVHTLKIDKSRMDDASIYRVSVKDKKTAAKVSVKEEPLEFLKPLADIEVQENQQIFMECTVSKPDRKAAWSKNGVKVSASETIKLKSEGSNHSLTIERAELTDQAEYAIKIDGKTSKADVKVIETDLEFIRPLEDINITEIPKTLVFEAEVSKINVPAKWYHNEKLISADDKHEIFGKGVIHRLTIKDADGKDEGSYKVVVKDKTSEAKLTVQVPPKIFIDKKYQETVVLNAGQSTAFEIPFTGNPQPKVTWTFKSGPLPDAKRMEAETIYNMTTVRLGHVIRADSGDYTVKLENTNGVAEITINMLVLDKPSVPRDFKVTDITAETATLTWTPPEDDGGKPVKSYTLEKRDASRQTWTAVADVKDATPYIVKGLSEGKQYVFRVCAKNDVGASKFVESDTITAKNPFDVPDAPEAPVVTDVFKDNALVTWQPPANDNGAPVTGYLLERKSDISPRWVAVNKEPITATEMRVADLMEDNSYQFRVSAVNKAGPSKPSEPSPTIKAKDPWVAPGRPGTPEATGTDKSSVALKWSAPESDGGSPITNYIVEFRPEGSSQWKRANESTTVPDTTFSVTGLKQDRKYEFRVTAENKAGLGEPSKATGPIKVVEPVEGVPPVLLEPLQDIAVIAPKDAILECDIDVGEPEAEIKWFRGKKEVKKSSKYEMSYEDEVASLVIHKTEPQDSDVYRCEAANPLGKVQTEGTLSIHTMPTLEYDNRLKSAQTVKAGSTIVLKVNVAGIPYPNISWLLDGQQLDKSDRVSIETNKEFSTLTIKNATIKDTGVYTISAENVVGKAAADFEVNVKDKPGKPENLRALEILKNSIALAWEPPTNAGGSAITGYIVEKREANKNTWMPVTTTDGTTTTFSAQKLSEGKEYFFRVSAQNDFGAGEPAELKEGIVAKSPFDAPEAPKKLTATEITKSSMTLTWEPPESDGGSPITGYLLERKSPSSSRWVRVNKSPIRDTVYTVTDLREGDELEFRVMAENAAGFSNPSAATERLVAKDPYDKPEAPKRPEPVDITRATVTLKWMPPPSDGGDAIFNYVVEYRPTSAVRWKTANPEGGAVAETSYTVKELEEGAVYEFRVAAENKAGVGPFSPPSEPVTAAEPIVGEAPTVLEGLPDIAVTEGDTAMLGCKISGEPAPTIKWLRDSREIREDKRHEMVYQDFVASLVVKDVQNKDAGSYTCEASNDLGTVNTSGVLEIQAPPTLDFDNKFKDLITLHAGATLKIPVRVGGIPSPSISWMQENKSIRSGGKITVDIQENSTCLTVKKVSKDDDGLYSLVAENEVGEATAKFDVEILDKPTAPEGPIIVSDLTRDSAVLTWKPPKDDGGCDITAYVVERRDAKRNVWTKVATLDGVTLDYKATGLAEGTDYQFRVMAENEVGQSEPLETSTAVTPKSPFDKPSAPEGPIEFMDIKADSVTLTWKPPASDGGSPLKNYIVERKDARKTNWTKVASVDAKSPLSCVAQKLLEDVPYIFRVMAVNDEGQSPPLEADKEIVPKAPADVPGKPTGPIKFSQVLADSVTLSWGPPKKDGGSVVTSYTVEQSRDGGRSWEQTGSVDAGTTTLTAKDLKEGQKYKFRVCANNAVGAGLPLDSDSVTPQRQITKPSEPTGPLTVEDVRKDSVLLSWKPPSDDGGSPLTGYVILKRDQKRPTWSQAGKCDATTTAFKVKDLLEGTEYFFKVVAENKVGQSDGLETDAATLIKSPYDKPSAPKGPIEFKDLKADSVTLTWQPSASDGGSPIKEYTVERKDARKTNWTKVASVDAKSPLSCVAQKLLEDVPYIFRVMAVNDEGQSPPLEADKEIVPKAPADVPGKPTGPIKFSQILSDSVTLSWAPPKKDGGSVVTSYTVEQSHDGGRSWEQTGTVDAGSTTLTAKDLKEGQKYKFRVCANNEVGAGLPLESDSVTPQRQITKPSQPTGPLKVEDIRKDSVLLSWKPPSDDGGSPLTGYVIMKRDQKRPTWTQAGKCDATTTAFKVKDLLEGTEYFFKVVAENKTGQGEGLETEASTLVKSPFDKPSAPEGPIEFSDLKADSVTLTWKPSPSDGGSPIQNYIVERKDARKTNWTKVASVDAKSPQSCVAQKLLEDAPYIFRVMAVNVEGQSPPLEADKEIVPKTPADVPGKPTGPIKFSQVLADSVTLSWGPPKKDGGSVVTSYTVEQSRDGGRSWEQTGSVDASTTMLTAKDLKEGQKYKFRVCANNAVGAGLPLDSDSVTPQRQITKPSTPNGPLSAQDVQKDSVTLTWKPPTDDGGSPLTGYVILKRDHKRSTWSPAGKCDGSTTEFKVKDLLEGTQYFFKVVAENKAGQSDGLETEAPTHAKSPFEKPSPPVGPLEISNVTDCSADLAWKPPKSDGGSPLTSYIIESRPSTRSTWNQSGKIKGDQTSFTVPDLRLDTEYLFRVTAVNSEGQSQPLEGKETAKPMKKISPPEPPQNVHAARIGADYVTLEWKPPAKDGGSKVTGYKIQKCEEIDGDWVTVKEVKAIDTTFKVERLKENVGYYFSVSAKNEAGYSEPCEADALIKPKKPEGPPDIPEGPIELSDLDKTTVTLTWRPPTSDGGSPLTAYIIERREAARTQWTKLDSTLPSDTSLTTRNLIEGNEYYFRVCAENKHGRSQWLETDQSVKMRSPFEKPGRPVGPMELSDLTKDSVTLSWKPPESDGGTPITKYIIESRPSARSNWAPIGEVKGESLNFTADNLREGTEYHFRVLAVNKEGQGPALEAKETVKPEKKVDLPGPPSNLKIGKIGTEFVTLDWKAPVDNGGAKITGYKVEMADVGSDKWVKVADVDSYDTSYKVTGLKDDKAYLFAVSAKNSAGYGEACQTDKEVKTKKLEGKPGAPQGPLQVTDVEKTSVTLAWKPPTSDGGSPLTGYVVEKKEATRPTWTKVETISPNHTTFTAKNLLEGSEYQFRVTAENKHGASSPLVTDASVKPKSKFDKPSKPIGPIEFSDVTDSTVTLSWKPPSSDGGKPIEKYIIEHRDLRRSTWTKAGTVPGDATTFTADKLLEGNSYMFRVTAVNAEGESQPLESQDTVKPQKPATTPGLPTNLKVKEVGKDFVKIEWSQPKSDGGSKVTGYRLLSRVDGSDDWKDVGKVGALDTSFTFKDLSDKKKYFFAVVAENKLGQGDRLETESSIKPKKPATKPSPPVGPIKFSDLTRTSVTLSWRPSEDDGGDMITGYILEKKEAWKTVWSPVTEVSPDITSYCVQKLRENQEYVFRVLAENSVGRSLPLESDSVTPKHPYGPPSAPQGPLETSDLTATTVTLSWQPPKSDGGQPLTGYVLERRDTKRSTWTPVEKVKPNVNSYTVQDLSTGVDYHFRVTAENKEGVSPPLETSATVRPFKELEPPSSPKGPMKLSDFTETSVTMHWQQPAEDGGSNITDYVLEVQEGNKDWKNLTKVESYTTKYKAVDLKEGTQYKFRVSAVNKVGQSKPLESDQVVLEKPPEKPGPPTHPFTMTEFTKSSITLTWGPSQSDGGSAILHYILEKRESWKSTFQHVSKVKPAGEGQKLTHCVDGLKEDQDYMFRVFAENAVGASKAIETDVPYKPRSPFSVPESPVGPIVVEDVGVSDATIRWRAPESTGGLELTSYLIERRDTRHTSWIKVDKVEPNIFTYCIQNLQEGNEYVFRVYAENPEGRSLALETKVPVIPGKAAAAPSVPTGPIRFEDVKETTLSLDWLPPKQDGGSPITGYIIKMSVDGGDFEEVDTTGSQTTKLKVKDLKTGSKHVFQVLAENKVGRSKPLESEKVVPQRKATKPSQPKGPLLVKEVNRTSCTIQWNPPEDDGGSPLKNYLIEKRDATRTSWSRADKISPDITTHCIQNLTEGADYYFRVFAENKVGTSEPLEMDKAVKIKSPYDKPSAPIGPIKVSDVKEKSATLSWQAPDSDGGLPLTGYIVQVKESRRSTWTTFREATSEETSITLTGLVPDTEYVAQVIAVNKEGQSPGLISEPIKPKKILGVPSAPQSVHIRNMGKDSLTVEWSAPDTDGGARIKKYVVEQSKSGSDKWTKVATVDSYKTFQAVSDLEQEVEWLFAVSAVNEVGTSEKGVTSKAIKLDKPIEPPSPPVGPLEFSNITKKSGRVSWKPSVNDGGSPITHYAVEKRETWKTTWLPVERVPSDKTSCDLLHLTEGQEIFVRVMAENVAGTSKPLEGDNPLLPKSPYDKPSAPQDLKATNVTSSTATLQWRAPSDTGGLPITSYLVERRDKRWGSWVKAGSTKGGVTTLDVTSLLEGSEYFFRVSAENEEGFGPAVEISQAVMPVKEPVAPERPVGPIRFSSVLATSLTLEWLPPREDGGAPITAYKVEVSSKQDVWTEVTITDANVTKVNVKDLKEGQKVWFRVTAFNKVGASKPLDSDSITPQRQKSIPSPPTRPIEAKVLSRDSVSLEWGPPEDDGGSPITGYVVEKREALRMSWSRAEKVTGTDTKTTVRNLVEGSDFLFRVAAVNREGTSDFLEMERPLKVKSPYSVPSAPEGPLKISDITQDSCVLEWSPPRTDGGQPLLNYAVEIRESRRSMWGRAGTAKPDKTSFTARNLVVNNEYHFRVRAINAEGESEPLDGSESIIPKIKQDPPSKPASINIPKSPAGTLTVEWKPPNRDGGARVKKYIVQMKEDSPSSDWADVGKTDAFTTKLSVPNLDSEKKYKFRVAALNDVGQGDFLETQLAGSPAKTLYAPSPPQNLRVTDVQRDSVGITWDHSASDGGSPVTNYIIEKKEQWKSTWSHVDRVKSVVTSWEVLYLTEGTAYEIRVMAENAVGISEPTVIKEAVVPESPYKPPSAPVGPLEAKEVTSTTATIAWKPPQSDGGLPIKRYTIERRDAKRQAWMKVDSVKPTATSYQVTGLVEGTNYVFRVFAENAEGVSSPLESDVPVTCRRAPEKPGAPSGKLKVSKVTPDTVTLDWLPPLDDGGSPLTGYIIEAMEGDSREWKTVADVEPAATRHLVRNLTEGQDYRFRICAQNAIGRSKPVETDSSVTPSRPMEPPGAPRGPLKAEVLARDSIKLSWQPPLDDGGMPLSAYIVDKLDIQRGGWVRAARILPDETNHVVSGLITDHDYNFRVYAENKIGVGEPLDMKASIKCKSPYNVPSAPRNLVISDVTDESAQIEWSAPEKDGGAKITGYVIEKRDSGKQQWTRVGQTDAKTRSIKARNLLEGRPYSFRVMAENAEGLSEPLTLQKTVTPMKPIEPPAAPENLECVRVEREAATLQWKKPRVDGGATITGYVVEKREGKAASWVPAGETDALTTSVTYVVQNLLEDYEYAFRVKAKNSAGLGEAAVLKESVIPSRPLEKPSAPVGPLEVSNITEDSVTLTWHKPEADGGAPVTNYIVEKCDTRRPRWVRVDSVPSDETEFKVQNLLEGVDYKFRVMAENKVGVSEPLETDATVRPVCPYGPPTAPVGPIKTSKITRDSATLQWEKPESDGGSPITGYLVERREGSKRAWMYCGRTDGGVTGLTVTALYENNEYLFRVYAENKYGRSKPLDSETPVVPKRIF
ncbi:titin, partial [Plakobranchus ocellatus]